ncbi:MAG: nucleotidyltransferase [Clostridiales bacterium]|nr:nucleotidyltransferase [Clostridiales bacterium]
MAAGIGSRFGQGIKQLEPVGPAGEIIMDYSIHDALEAGFNRIVFIIRKDLEKDSREIIGSRIEKVAPVTYVFQELSDLPGDRKVPADRKKPWGTGQAVLSCLHAVDVPFVVINADDYYGKEAFVQLHDFLLQHPSHSQGPYPICMAGFILKNTLSDNGTVTRGICRLDEEGSLVGVDETRSIMKTDEGAAVLLPDGTNKPLDAESYVSMNMWGFTPDFLQVLQKGFEDFLDHVPDGDLKAEYLLPDIIDGMIQKGEANVVLLPTPDRWFGITYQEDKYAVKQAFTELVEKGFYPAGINR